MSSYRISQLAERTGFSPSTLRYYEQVGLLTTERTSGGYRSYGEADVRRLQFIARAKQLGLPLDGIRELVAVWEGGPCASVKARLEELLTARSADVADRLSELTAFGTDLARARDGLTAPSPDGPCDDSCGCTSSSEVRTADLGMRRPVGAAPTGQQQPAQPAEIPLACTLSGDGQAAQRAEWAELLGRAAGRAAADGGADITFPADPDLAGQLAALAAREKDCCAFFAFSLDLTSAGSMILRVRAPQGAQPLVTGLLGQCGAARAEHRHPGRRSRGRRAAPIN
jgi:DNA-binding transcriptional MerR regulator